MNGVIALLVLALQLAEAPAAFGDAAKGEKLFRQRCAVCHPTGERGGQAPGLANVMGRKAGTGAAFNYSRALVKSGLTWDEATLNTFLTLPSALVPGTKMPIVVPGAEDRRNIIAYLATLKSAATEEASKVAPASGAAPGLAPNR